MPELTSDDAPAEPPEPESLEEAAEAIRAKGTRALGVSTNVRRTDELRRLVDETVREFGRVDILVNNVGGAVGGNPDVFRGDDSAFQDALVLNLTSAFWAIRAVAPSMRERGYGRIINIGSGASRRASASPG